MEQVRLGAVPYLNARPLIFFEGLDKPELLFGTPRQLVGWLEEGRIDAGTIPTFFHLAHPSRPIVEGIGIVSQDGVESVRLFLRREVADIQAVAVDEGSMTSVALLKIILRHGYGVQPEFVPRPPDLKEMMEAGEAALLIGDAGMRAAKEGAYPSLDLGQEWHGLTGLPFVWALWVCRDDAAAGRVGPIVRRAKRAGLRNVEEVARRAAAATGFEEADCLDYLSRTLHYDLGAEEAAAIEEYRRLWQELL